MFATNDDEPDTLSSAPSPLSKLSDTPLSCSEWIVLETWMGNSGKFQQWTMKPLAGKSIRCAMEAANRRRLMLFDNCVSSFCSP